MKNAMKKLTAILMAVLLVFQTAPVSILAEGPEDYAGQPLRNTTRDGKDGPFGCSVDVSITQDAFSAIHSEASGSKQPDYYLVALNGSEPFGYAKINSLTSTENNRITFTAGEDGISSETAAILSTTSFVIAEYDNGGPSGDSRSVSDILNGADRTIARNEACNGIRFGWDSTPSRNPDGSGTFRFSISLESETAGETTGRKGFTATRGGEQNQADDVVVTIRNTGDKELSLSSGYYYLVAGWNNGTDSYTSETLPYSLTGEYSFNTASLPTSHNQLFVILKRYDYQTDDPRRQEGTAIVSSPTIYGVSSDKNTTALDGGLYSFELTGPTEENGKKYFTINVEKKTCAKATVSLAGGVSTEDLFVVFRQQIQNSADKAYSAIRVTGSGTYEASGSLMNPYYGEQPFNLNAPTEVCIVRANEPGADLASRDKSWVFQGHNFNNNNGLTVYRNGSSYMGNPDHTVTIIPETLDAGPNTSRISIGASSYTARLDLYDSWDVKHTDPVAFDPVSVTASNGQEEFSGYISGNGTIETLTDLPADLTDWSFGSTDFGGYILTDTVPAKEGNVYVFEARKPDTYTVRLRYTEAWSEEETANHTFSEPGTVTATGADGQSYTGTIGTDGSLTMDPVPAITEWSINGDNRSGDFTFKPSAVAGQENPSVDNETHTYILTLRKNRTYRAEIEYHDSWGRGKISEAVPVGEGYSIEARDKDGASYTGTIDPETGAVHFGQELPEIASWAVLHNGAAEEEQKIGEFAVHFDESNPAEEARYDAATDGAAGYYVITAVKPDTYSAELSFYRADSDEPLESVVLPETYVIRAEAEDNTVYSGTVSASGEITWEDGITELPKITAFRFFKADGTEETDRFGSYRMEVLSYEDDELRAAGGVYRLIGREPKLYPSMLKYVPAPVADWSAHYYLVAGVDGEKAAYAELPHANTERLTFIPFGNAAGKLGFRMAAADADGASSAPGVRLPEDAEFTLVKDDGELSAAEIYSAAAAPAVIEDYVLELKPEIEVTSAGAGEQEEDTLVFRAQKMWTGNVIRISTYDYNGTTLKAPDSPFGSNYYLRVRILDQETNTDVGWNLIPISDWAQSSQGDTTEITVERFTQLGQNPLNDGGANIWQDFDPAKHYIEVDTEAYPARVIRMTDTDWLNWDKATNPYYADDEPPEGYQYIKGTQEADAYRIRLKKAKETEYTVTLKFDTTDASRINLDGGLYVRVTVGHQSGENTYGWVPLSNAGYKKSPNMYTKDGCTYIDVPISEWKDANGNTISGEKFRGTEESIKVELVGAAPRYGQQPTPGNSAPMKIGSYVNKAEVTAYPTGTENVDRFTDDSGESVTKIRDVVTLTLEPDKFDGYSLEYVLNGYNIVTLCPNTTASPSNSGAGAFGDGDFLMRNHCMGGVLIRGDIIHITGTGVADSEYITVPSVVGGYVPASAGPFINNRENNNNDWNAYIGSVNTVAGETVNGVTAQGSPSKPRPDGSLRGYTGSAGHTAAYGDTFVDWDRLQTEIVNASDKLAANGRELSVSFPQADYQQEVTINVTLGDNVTVNYPENVILTVNIIAPEGLDLRDSENIPATIVNNTGTGTYTAPKVTVNGQKLTTEEDGSGMSLVWNFPNAEQVNLSTQVTPFFGHIVAPRSYIDVEGGNYSGCMVGNKVSSAGEGHLYPYTGGKLTGKKIGFEASKTVDELPPDPDQLFYFDLERLNPDSGEWERIERVTNQTRSVGFTQIDYNDAGTYYYRISEFPKSVSSDIRLDATLYVVKSVVEPVLDGLETKLVSTETYYRVPEGVTDYTEYYEDGETIRQRINESVLEDLNVPEGTTGAEVAAQYLTFNNTSKNNSSITARKTLTGAELAEDQFAFTIEKTSEPEAGTGSVNEENLRSPAKNNGNGLVNFGKLTFTLEEGKDSGTWVYTVKETQPDPVPPYYVYDRSEYEITFRVTRADGTLNVQRSIRKTMDASGAAADIPADSITFANTRETGSLTISKTVVSPIPAEETQVFHFTVSLQLDGQPVAGKFGAYTFGSDGQAVIQVAGGSSVTIPGLPAGTTYRVVEAEESEDSVFATEKTEDYGTIVKEGKTAAFTNTRETGSLSISKRVVSPFPADAEKEFSFDIVLSDESITGDFAGTCIPAEGEESGETTVRFSRGKASVKVRGGKTLTIQGLPAGITYTVTETEERDFETEKAGDSGEITQDGVTAAFTNTRKTGDLEISKTVSGTSDKTKVFHFRITLTKDGAPYSGTYAADATDAVKTANSITDGKITFTEGKAVVSLKADEKITVKGLPKGVSYTVEELDDEEGHPMPAGYQQTAPAGNAQGTIVDEVNKAEFENTYSLQTTSVSFGGVKHIEGTDSTDKVFIFELYETGADYSIEGITPAETATSGSIGTAGQDYSFEKITYDTKGQHYYYVVREKAFNTDDYKPEGWTRDETVYRIHVLVEDGGEGKLTAATEIFDGEGNALAGTDPGSLDFTNRYEAKGNVSFKAKKAFTGGTISPDKPFTIRLTQVTTDDIGTAEKVPGTVPATATVSNADEPTVSFSGVREFVKGTDRNDCGVYYFLLEEVIPEGADENNIRNGIRYDGNRKIITVTVSDNGDGMLNAMKEPAEDSDGLDVTFTNEQLGSVIVTKTFELNGAALPPDFAITASYTDGTGTAHTETFTTENAKKNDQQETITDPYSWEIRDLPIGTEVTLTESGYTVNGYSAATTFTSPAEGGGTAVSESTTGKLKAAENPPTGAFVNTYTRETGSLKLKKTVTVNNEETTGKLADGTYSFRIHGTDALTSELADRIISVTITNGKTEKVMEGETSIDIGEDGYAVISGLPTGTYTVTEEPPAAGITIAEKPENAIEIKKDEAGAEIKTAVFRNNKDAGDLLISKTVTGTTDNTKDFIFDITLTPPAGISLADNYPAETADSVRNNPKNSGKFDADGRILLSSGEAAKKTAAIVLKAGESVRIKDLPSGTGYTVSERTDSESMPAGYQKTSGDAAGSISATLSTAAFVNSYTAKKTSAAFGGIKRIQGTERTEKEFFFELYQADEQYRTAGDPIQMVHTAGTIQASAGKSYGFEAITYNTAGDYYYVVKEKAFDQDTYPAEGWTLSTDEYHLHVHVYDSGNGSLAREIHIFRNDNPVETTGTAPENSLEFMNTYKASGETDLKVQKVFTNGKLSEKRFSFRVTQVDSAAENAQAVTEGSKLAQNPSEDIYTGNTDGDSDIVTLADSISFTEADAGKTFRFRVEEVTDGLTLTDNIADGIRYDAQRSKLITVTVSDKGDGSLIITKDPERASGTDYDVSFTNEQLGKIRLKKTVKDSSGQPISTDNRYTFTISGNGEDRTVEVGANTEPVTVENLPLGTYTVTETECPAVTGYNYTGTTLKADNGTPAEDTSLAVTITNSGEKTVSVEAANTYERKTGTAEIGVTKDYNNWGDGKNFTFTLTAGDNDADGDIDTPMPEGSAGSAPKTKSVTVNSEESREAGFGSITFDRAGTYHYTIRETGTVSDNGVTYDTKVYAVQVDVTEETGDSLTTAVSYGTEDAPETADADSLAIRNTYHAEGSVELSGTKTLEGRLFREGETFSFRIRPVDGAPLRTAEGGEKQEYADVSTGTPEGSTAPIRYGMLYFSDEDLAGADYGTGGRRTKVFVYTVSENVPEDKKGIEYAEPKTLKILVTDNGNGKLTAVPDGESEETDFTNTYTASGETSLKAQKIFTNGKLSEKSFSFRITQVDSDADNAQAVTGSDLKLPENPLTVTTGAENTTDRETVTLADIISFTEADAGKTFRFRVEEVTEGLTLENNIAEGVRYDAERSKLITVTVTDLQDGSPLVITKSPESASGADYDVSFTNEQLGGIRLNKLVKESGGTGSTINTDNKYTFTISGNGITRKAEVTANGAAVTVGDLPLGTYTVTETGNPDISGYSYKETKLLVDGTTTVSDRSAEVTIDNSGTKTVSVTATNLYETKSGEAELRVTKDYNNWGDGKTFTFILTAGDNDAGTETPMPEGSTTADGRQSLSVTLESSGTSHTAEFGKIVFSKAGTYNYTIRETAAGDTGGLTIDSTEYRVAVTVTEKEGSHELEATARYATKEHPETADQNSLTIRNTYSAAGSESFAGTKTLKGRTFREGDRFSFTVTPVNGAPLRRSADEETAMDTVTAETAAGESSAGIDYGTFHFTFDDLKNVTPVNGVRTKTFEYTVAEKVPEGDRKGIAYADPQTLRITVTDRGTGTLEVTAAQNTEAKEFVNTYDARGHASFAGTKKLEGRPLTSEDSFRFTITPVDGAPLRRSADETLATDTVTAEKAAGTSETTVNYGEFYFTLSDLEGAAEVNGVRTKTFEYTVAEEVPKSDRKGITYAEPGTLRITVTDNGTGTLTVTPADQEAVPEFTNTYEASGSVVFRAKKTFTNGKFSGHPFTIRLTQVKGDGSPEQAEENIVLDSCTEKTLASNVSASTVTFDPIRFVKNGTVNQAENGDGSTKEYWFLIEELVPDGLTDTNRTADSIRYDSVTQKWIRVTLTDDGNGKLTVAKDPDTGTAPDAAFTNEQLGAVRVSKAFTGETVNVEDSFAITAEYTAYGESVTKTLKISGAEGAALPVKGEGTAEKPYIWEIRDLPVNTDVTFTESGFSVNGYSTKTTFNEAATADPDAPAGVVRVGTETQTGAFVNAYTRDTGKLKIRKTVTVNGSEEIDDTSLVDGTYSFTIRSADGSLERTVLITISGGKMTEATENGDSLTIRDGYAEVDGLPTGDYTVTEDESGLAEKNLSLLRKPESPLTVVKDEEGAVVPTADFENGRDIGSLEISKKVNGTSDRSKFFTFEVRLSMNSAPLSGSFPAEASASVLQASGIDNGKITFDAGGEATVVLKADEKIVIRNLPAGAGYTVRETGIPEGYSKTKPGGDAADAITTGVSKAEFENMYNLLSTNVTFGGKKTIRGTSATETVFTFRLYETGEDYSTEGVEPIEVRTSGMIGTEGQNYSFSPITYSKDENNKTYYYVITEEPLNPGTTGWTTDTTVYKRKVVVSDGGSGTLKTTVTDENGNACDPAELNFVNTYSAKGSVSFSAKKKFLNGDLSEEGKTFTIRLSQVADENSIDPPAADKTVLSEPMEQTVHTTDSADEQVASFSLKNDLFFKGIRDNAAVNQEGEYLFLLEEIVPDGTENGIKGGVRYEANSRKWIKVTVTDKGDGTLTAVKHPAPEQDGGTDLDAVFTNEQLGSVKVSKIFEGHDVTDGFRITAKYTAGGKENTRILTTGSDSSIPAETTIKDGKTKYTWTLTDLPVGTKVSFTESGITADGYTVTTTFNGTPVPDRDAPAGETEAQKEAPDGAFINTYTRDRGSLKIVKTVTVNDDPQAAADTKLVDGSYTFTVTGSGKAAGTAVRARIGITGGKAVSAEFAEGPEDPEITIRLNDAGEAVIGMLPTGEYTVAEELTPEQEAKGIRLAESSDTSLKVVKDGTGSIPAASFRNNREAGELKISKTVARTTSRDKAFLFTVTLKDQNGDAVSGTFSASWARNGGTSEETITFENGTAEISLYADESVVIHQLPGGSSYTVHENPASIPDGYSQTKPAGGGDAVGTIGRELREAAFENTYNLRGTSLIFGGRKMIEVAESTTQKFRFELFEVSGENEEPGESQKPLATAETDGTITPEGKDFTFGKITYEVDTKGGNVSGYTATHFYVVRESALDENGCWTAAKNIYRKKVVLTDDGSGDLKITINDKNLTRDSSSPNLDLKFTNRYKASGTVSFSARKTFTGGDLSSHPFTIRLSEVAGENKTEPVSEDAVWEKTVSGPGNTQTVVFNEIKEFHKRKNDGEALQDDTGEEHWFLLEEAVPDDAVDGIKDGVRYDSAFRKWIKVTLKDDGEGNLEAVKEPGEDKDGLDAAFANEQLGGVAVSKAFIGHEEPENFTITAKYTVNGTSYTRILTTGSDSEIKLKGSGTTDDPYLWEIGDLPLNTLVTFTENNIAADDYTVTPSFNGNDDRSSGAVRAAVTAPTGKFINSYTRDSGPLKIRKTVTVNSKPAETAATDGTYRFTVDSAEGVQPKTTKQIEITFRNGKAVSAVIDGKTAFPDTDGCVQISGLPTGNYSVSEDEDNLPEGMRLVQKPTEPIPVVKDGTGTIPTAEFTNDIIEVCVKKVDAADGKELKGALIRILEGDTVADEWISDDSEEGHMVTGLKPGVVYTLHEETAPKGYLVTADTTFTIGETGKVTAISAKTRDENGKTVLLVEDELIPVVSLSLLKIWKDENNRDGVRPASLSAELLADGKVLKTISLTAGSGWAHTEEDLPKFDQDNNEITYSWKEKLPAGYTQESLRTNGNLTTLTNLHTPASVSVSVRKVWDDNGNSLGKRPASVRVQLFADGKAEGGSVVLNDANGWSHTWTGLKKCGNANGQTGGKEIVYTVEETEVPAGYTMTRTGSAADGFVITNSMKPGSLKIRKKFSITPDKPVYNTLIDIPVNKIWDDFNNRDGNRPASITVRLYAGGEEVRRALLTEAGGWEYIFSNLPKYKGQQEIVYSISEDPVPLYRTEIRRYSIINRYMPPLTCATVHKIWKDNDNAMRIRPASIRMTLSNGTRVVLNAANHWTATVSDLPAVVNGEPAVYTWKEQEANGYRLTGTSVNGTLTTFTNTIAGMVKVPKDLPQPKVPGDVWYFFPEYETALGGVLLINHVGDCFD